MRRPPQRASRALALAVILAAAALAAGVHAASDAPRAASLYSAAALYNAGNAAARRGELARAIVEYQRAQLLSPLDADVRANLRTVRARAGASSVAERDWRRSARLGSPRLVFVCGLVGLLLAGGGWLARELLPRWRRRLTATAAAGATLLALAVIDGFATAPVLRDAVVLNEVAASASPTRGGETLFRLTSGDTVSIETARDDFWLIGDAQGREGWVPREMLERVVPPRSSSP